MTTALIEHPLGEVVLIHRSSNQRSAAFISSSASQTQSRSSPQLVPQSQLSYKPTREIMLESSK
jgi:hypothetical protein